MTRLAIRLSILLLTLPGIAAAMATWSSHVESTSTYSVQNNVVARFTPDQAITVTRIELQSAFGSSRAEYSLGQYAQCAKPISFQLTDGTTSYTLTLPGPSVLPVPYGSAASANFSSFADSGRLDLRFRGGNTLTVLVLQGDAPQGSSASACFATATSVTVQYHVDADFRSRVEASGSN
jgi:hypothetical protein